MSNKELDVLIGVVSRYYPSEINDSGNWKPAKLVLDTDEAFGVEVSFWPKKDESGKVIAPIKIPVLDAIDLETIEGKEVQIVCVFQKIYKRNNGDEVRQYSSARKVKIIGENAPPTPKPKPEPDEEADEPEEEASKPTPAPQPMTIDERIRWNSAVNNAVSRLSFDGDPFDGEAVSKWIAGVDVLALALNKLIQQGPVEPIEAEEEVPEQEESDGVIDVDGEV